MRAPRVALVGWLVGRLTRLRFPTLFLVSAVLFLVTLVVPDPIPLADELLLGLATALLASWRKRRLPHPPDPADGAQTPANSGR
jgi:hypothetical protein